MPITMKIIYVLADPGDGGQGVRTGWDKEVCQMPGRSNITSGDGASVGARVNDGFMVVVLTKLLTM